MTEEDSGGWWSSIPTIERLEMLEKDRTSFRERMVLQP